MMRLVAAVLLITTATAVAAPPGETPPGEPSPPPPAVTPPATSERAPALAPSAAVPKLPPCDPAPRPPERAASRSVLLEVVVGGALGIGGLYGGAYLGYRLDCANGCPGEFGGVGGILWGGALGLTITATAGVMIVGIDNEHRSSVGLTWLGTVLGGVVGGVAAAKVTGENIAGSTVLLATGTALGGALMFHATRTRRRAPGLQVVPFAGDGSVGLSLVGAAP